MSRSYRKTIQCWPAHVRFDHNHKRHGKKSLRQWLKALRDEDGTPILPHLVRSRRPPKWFGGNSYDRWVYQFRVIGGKLVSTSATPGPWPGSTEREFRHYRCK